MKKHKILVIDDIKINREILIDILGDEYEILEGETGLDAVELANKYASEVYLILLDIMMSEMDGFESLRILKSSANTEHIPVIIITAAGSYENEIQGLGLGAVDFVSKPFNPDVVRQRVHSQVRLREYSISIEGFVEEKVRQIELIQDTMIDFLANIVEYRDLESGQHVKRTRQLVRLLIEKISLAGLLDKSCRFEDKVLITKAVTLHDIGKIGIPDAILCKPGKLTPEEFDVIKRHTVIGAEIVDKLSLMQEPRYLQHIKDICLYHHEKWDGSGYPAGLKGDDIPYSARLMAIVDVYDALIEKRVYKPAFTHQDAIEIISDGLGKHFDPTIGQIFIEHNLEFYEKFNSVV